MGTQAVSTYQQVIEKTKGLAFRSQMLVMNIEKKLAPKPEVSPSDVILFTVKIMWFALLSDFLYFKSYFPYQKYMKCGVALNDPSS